MPSVAVQKMSNALPRTRSMPTCSAVTTTRASAATTNVPPTSISPPATAR